jgi:hypothetical protein
MARERQGKEKLAGGIKASPGAGNRLGFFHGLFRK